ncbi:NOL1/NOP2/sun family putative RNA met [Histomonas meleagridis]|uniref:NOL1/NOP2/sun family putative RNA met n=1 Tax=Histomonas meleagridis TaxID=135588 RepID=UPI00355A981F|nr:NOL1/NOP2/sun family putative RNA met [Histomonas meleagridis]KAH0806522.1 NOL1/NOP2/sun family putative RNA met [Histomonas meleagridis]
MESDSSSDNDNPIEDEEENEDWLGSSGSEDEDDLARRERQLKKNQDEFLQELKGEQEHTTLVDLDAPAVDYDQIRDRATSIILTLQDLKNTGDPTLSRQDYVDKLYEDLCLLFGYNEFLMRKIASLVKIGELMDFCDANEHKRPVTIRVNTLRTRRKELERLLNERGVRLAPIGKWTRIGLVVLDSQVPVGATPEYLAGYYMLQSPSSFLPVMALNPQPNTRVLDMCAAPGGKTTHMAQLMKNTGVIIANDIHRARTDALIANIHRLAVTNTIVVNYDGIAFPTLMGGFDSVLLDAPCSGTGVISRDPTVKTTKTEAELKVLTQKQKELILHAYDSVKNSGGRLCYCTCSLLVEENEGVVDYLIKHRDACRVVPPDIDKDFDEELTPGIIRYNGHSYDPSIANTRRVYPHRMNMDGFYFAIIEVLPHVPQEITENNAQIQQQQQKNKQNKKDDKRKGRRSVKLVPKKAKKKKFSKRFGGK